jgi:L-seryl-tRNA(Ser) seleniumtransferase
MEDKNQIMRNLPQVEKLLQMDEIAGFIPEIGRPVVADIVREVLAEARTGAKRGEPVDREELVASIAARCSLKRRSRLQSVINGTGVVVHTNLGRSPLSAEALGRLGAAMSGYCNLEYDLSGVKRGYRGGFAEELLCRVTGAEACLVVNNNAASVFLILSGLGRGREAVVSRGELIQIGGGFRLPDIMRESGVDLVEVGTTNITRIEDFRAAVTERTAMIFSSHQSNFRIQGFTASPGLRELASLKSGSVLFIRDLGSGNLLDGGRLPWNLDHTPRYELEQGADLVCFSGDKLMGGCQAGIIVGRSDLVTRLRQNPLMRMMRVDKLTYFLLQETLLRYVNDEAGDIALWKMMFQDRREIARRIARFMGMMKRSGAISSVSRTGTRAVIGGGSVPGFEMESLGVQVRIPGAKAEELLAEFTCARHPVIGFISDGHYTLDFFTILDRDVPRLAAAAEEVIARHTGGTQCT